MMTLEEYKKELTDIESMYRKAKSVLGVRYAESNNPYKKGDVITDHIGTIAIEKITYSYVPLSNETTCVYIGAELKKNGEPKKNGATRSIYQRNIISNV